MKTLKALTKNADNMLKKTLLLTTLLIFVFGIQAGKTQSYSIVSAIEQGFYSNSPVNNLTVCTQYNLTYTINTSIAPASDKITINLPYGITFSSVVSAIGGSVTYLSGTTSPVLNVTRWSGTTLSITITVQTPSCSWVPVNPPSTHTTISGVNCTNNNYSIATFFTAGTPNMELTPLIYTYYNNAWVSGSSPLNVNPGETGEIVFKLENNGDGGIENINLNYTTTGSNVIISSLGYCTSTIETPCATYNTVPAPNTNNVILSSSDFNSLVGNPLFSQSDAPIYVHFYFQIANNCTNTGATFNFSLGCGSTNCQTYSYTTQFAIQPGTPNISASDINSTTTPSITNADGCEPTQAARTATMGFVFKNTGTPLTGPGAPPATNARANGLKIIFSVEREFASIDSSTFLINDSLHVPTSWVTEFYSTKPGYYTYQIDLTQNNVKNFGSNSLTDYSGSGIFDELAENSTFTVTVNYIYNNFAISCPADFASGGDRWDVPLFADAKYNNEFCSLVGNPAIPLSNSPSSLNSIGQFGYTHLSSSNPSITDSAGPNVTYRTGPNEPGPIVEMDICAGSYLQFWGSDLSANDYHFACPNADYQAVVKVPANYALNLADPTYSLTPAPCPAYATAAGACGCYTFTSSSPQITKYASSDPANTIVVKPIIEDYTGCAASCTGPNKIVVDFGNLIDTNPPFITAYNVNCFKVPIKLTCSCDSEPTGWDNFTFNFNYLCDPASPCGNCYDALAYASTQLSHHCDDTMPITVDSSSPGNSIFYTACGLYFKRTTLGWDYNNGGNDWTSNNRPSMLHLVDTVAANRARAYPGDEVEEKLNGSYVAAGRTMQHVYLETTWHEIASLIGPQTFFDLEPTKSKFVLVDGTYSLTCTASCTPSIIDSLIVYDVQIDSNGINFIDLHKYDNVNIYADLFWVVQTKPIRAGGNTVFSSGAFPLQQLQAGYYGTDMNNKVYVPNTLWASNFEILQPSVQEFYTTGNSTTTYCQNITGEFAFIAKGGLYSRQQDDFPNEFRPYGIPTGPIYVTIPTGYTYQPGSGVVTAYTDHYVNNPATNYIAPLTIDQYTVAIAPTNTVVVPGGTQYEFQPNWPLLDCKYGTWAPSITITYSLMPICSAPTPSYFIGEAQYQTSIQQYDTALSNNASCGMVTEGLKNNPMDTSIIIESQVNPQIDVACPALSPSVLSHTTTFTVTVSNNSDRNAPDAWISLQQIASANLWVFDTASVWHSTINSGNRIHATYNYADASGGKDLFIDYGPLANGASDVIIIQVSTNPAALSNICNNTNFTPDTNTIDVLYGNECVYKSITSPDNSCEEGACSFHVNWYPSTVSLTQVAAPSSMDLCHKNYAYTFSIDNNDAGTTVNPMFWLNLPAGLKLINTTFSYTDQSRSTYTATATSSVGGPFGSCACDSGWNIYDNSLIPQLGASGEGFQGGTNILVTVTVQTSCHYNGGPITFYSGGTTSCGYVLNTTPVSSSPDSIYSSCALTLTTTDKNINCNGGNSGTATVYASGISPYTYTWSTVPAQTTQTVSGLSAGNYTVTVSDQNGCPTTAEVIIKGANAVLSANISGKTNAGCNGDDGGTASVTASGGDTPYTYSWVPEGGNNSTATGLSAGNYTVTVTDPDGCTATASTVIKQPTAMSVSAFGPQLVCSGASANLTCSVSGGVLPYTYLWSNAATTDTTTVNPVTTTTYTLTVTDAGNCISKAIVTIHTNAAISVGINGARSFCGGGSATLTASATGGDGSYNFLWLPRNSTTQAITVSPTATSVYTVEVTDGCGSSKATATAIVTVNPIPVPSFRAYPTSGCVPLCVDFRDLSTIDGGHISKWDWKFGNGDTSSLSAPLYCYHDTGKFNVSLTIVSDSGCINKLEMPKMVTVYPSPKASFIYAPQPISILDPQVQFTASNTGQSPIINWSWTFGDGTNTVSNLQNPSHIYSDTGTYCTTLIVMDEHGCTDSVTNCLIVNPDFTFYIPNVFTPNGDGLNDVFIPKGSYVKDYEMYIYNRWGEQIFHCTDVHDGWNGMMNGGNVACQEGVYAYIITAIDTKGVRHQYAGEVTLIK